MSADVEKAVERVNEGEAVTATPHPDCDALVKLVDLDDWHTIRQALRDQDAEIARLRQWRTLVEEHNASCEAACDMDRCGYRPYFENNGRRCSECPHFNTIDIPPTLEPSNE